MNTRENSKVLLIILDGFGEGDDGPGNAITQASMPFFKTLRKTYPWTLLSAAGNAVGLPEGSQGNSEVGHFTLGSGRITWQSMEAIDRSIRDGSFFEKKELLDAIEYVQKSNGALHLLGMISDQGVHAHINHLFALMKLAKQHGLNKIFIHGILDGRDVPERSGSQFIEAVHSKITELGVGTLATLVGRFYAMDRDSNWDRTQKAYDLLTAGKGKEEKDAQKALQNAYEAGAETDYYVPPILLEPEGTIKDGDAVIFFNYRTDRSRQISEAFLEKNFSHFSQKKLDIHFVAMGPYTELAPVVFPCPRIKNNLGHVLSRHHIPQLRMAETEKYAHVTYFFNNQVETPEALEDREMIASEKCASYAEKPAMSARPLTDRLIQHLQTQKYSFIAMNYANADLVGHSGNLKATIECCNILDECLSKLIPAALDNGYTVLLTGDHGNAEEMLYPDGSPCPSHTTNAVIGMLLSKNEKNDTLKSGKGLQDIAPTILELMGIEKPIEMTGESLIQS